MRDWAKIAASQGLPLTALELDRVTEPLGGLERIFRPLIQQLTPDMEPDLELHLDLELHPGRERE
jgi:hypothetical protein